MSSKLHEAIYGLFEDSLDVFSYVDARRPDFWIVERQF